MPQFGIWVGGEKNIGYIANVENLHYDPYKETITALKMDVDRPLTFFGRVDELSRLDTLLDEHENVLLLNGIGGIGKTTVAKEYYHRYATKYDSLIWLDYRESLFDSFMSQKMQSYFHIIKLAQSAEEAFMSVVKTISQIEGNNLFVIDNLSNINDFIKYERYLPKNWKYLVTSRSNIEEYEPLYLDRLDEESAKKLFYKYYKFERDDETLIKIFQRVAYHTLTIEMIAKSYNKSKEKLSKAYDDLEKLGINLCDIEVRVEHNINAQKEIKYTIEKYLKFIFDTSTLRDKQTLILKQFLMLPTKTISLDEFITYTGFDRSECINTLEDIQEMGWIKHEENGYYLHQILKEVLLLKIKPSFEEVKYLVEYFKLQVDIQPTDNPMDKVKYIDYGIAIFDILSKKENKYIKLLCWYFLNQIGFLNNTLADYPKALEYYQKSLAINQKVFGFENIDTATNYNNIGLVYDSMGDYSNAMQYLQKALAIYEKVLGKEHPNIAFSYNNIGEVYGSMGDYPKTLEYHQKSLAIREKVFGKEHPSTAISYNNIGRVYDSMGDYAKALDYYKKDLAISEKVLGKEHPNTAISYNSIGGVYNFMGNYSKALKYHQKALVIKEKVFGKEHPDTAISYNNIGEVYRFMGDYPKALEYHQKALDIIEKVLGIEHPDTAQSYNSIGLVYRFMGDYPKALEYYQKDLAISEKVLGKEHPNTAQSYNNIGSLYYFMGDYPKALEFMQKAVDIFQKVLPANHPHLIGSKKGLEIIKSKM